MELGLEVEVEKEEGSGGVHQKGNVEEVVGIQEDSNLDLDLQEDSNLEEVVDAQRRRNLGEVIAVGWQGKQAYMVVDMHNHKAAVADAIVLAVVQVDTAQVDIAQVDIAQVDTAQVDTAQVEVAVVVQVEVAQVEAPVVVLLLEALPGQTVTSLALQEPSLHQERPMGYYACGLVQACAESAYKRRLCNKRDQKYK